MTNNGILFMGGLGGPKAVTVPCPPPHPEQAPLKGSWPFVSPERQAKCCGLDLSDMYVVDVSKHGIPPLGSFSSHTIPKLKLCLLIPDARMKKGDI